MPIKPPLPASAKIPYRVPRHWKPDGGKTILLTPADIEKCHIIESAIKAIEKRERRLPPLPH